MNQKSCLFIYNQYIVIFINNIKLNRFLFFKKFKFRFFDFIFDFVPNADKRFFVRRLTIDKYISRFDHLHDF